jgi:hypothetical protein
VSTGRPRCPGTDTDPRQWPASVCGTESGALPGVPERRARKPALRNDHNVRWAVCDGLPQCVRDVR